MSSRDVRIVCPRPKPYIRVQLGTFMSVCGATCEDLYETHFVRITLWRVRVTTVALETRHSFPLSCLLHVASNIKPLSATMETKDGVPSVVEMKFPISNFTKIRRMGAALIHADGHDEGKWAHCANLRQRTEQHFQCLHSRVFS